MKDLSEVETTTPVDESAKKSNVVPWIVFILLCLASVFQVGIRDINPELSSIIGISSGLALFVFTCWYLVSRKGSWGVLGWILLLFVILPAVLIITLAIVSAF